MVVEQRSEFVERAEIGRLPAQDVDEGLLGVLLPVERAEQNRALDLGIDGVSPGGMTRRSVVQLLSRASCASRGRPAAIGAVEFQREGPRSASVRSRCGN